MSARPHEHAHERPRAAASIASRIDAAWSPEAEARLDAEGFAVVGPILTDEECARLAASYDEAAQFRKTVVMDRHGFGRGEYRYFTDPLPPMIDALRAHFYARLVPTANRWNEQLGIDERFPATLPQLLARSEAAGQRLPTPLLLRYGPGDFNCLHQDLYGDFWFPLQFAVLLDRPGEDFTGGELVLVEQRPRMQSRPVVVPLRRGEAVVFPCHHRPRQGVRGFHRTSMRHGVSELRTGRRHVLGVIFHGAKT